MDTDKWEPVWWFESLEFDNAPLAIVSDAQSVRDLMRWAREQVQ